jgi:hypothetical protein
MRHIGSDVAHYGSLPVTHQPAIRVEVVAGSLDLAAIGRLAGRLRNGNCG